MLNQRTASFLFVINPISGGIDKSFMQGVIEDWSKKNKIKSSFYFTTGENDLEQLVTKIEEFSTQLIAVAVGGDGTLKLVAEAALETEVFVGLIPAGSANGMARELAIESISDAFDFITRNQVFALLNGILNGKAKKLDVVTLNNQVMLHLADFGLNARLIKDFEQEDSRGFSGYAKNAILQLVNREFFNSTIEISGQKHQLTTCMLAIANATRYGTGAVINPKGSLTDGSFELVVVKDLGWNTIITSMLSILTDSADYNKEYIDFFTAQEAKISLSEKVPFQIDGEYLGEVDQIKVKCLPGKLKFVVPAEKE